MKLKRMLILFVVLALLAGLLTTLPVFATTVDSGYCGENDNVVWTLSNDGTLTISGTGEIYMDDYGYLCPWDNYKHVIKKIIINQGISSIGANAFYGCDALTSVYIPDTVQTIKNSAFSECINLSDITMSKNIINVEDYAFNNTAYVNTQSN